MLTLKSFCIDHAKKSTIKTKDGLDSLLLSDVEWSAVEKLISILAPFDKYTKQLQSETVTLSDFYDYWVKLRIKTSKCTDELSTALLEELNKWNSHLMENPVMIAAIYLDPRFHRAISDDQKALAINFLVGLHFKVNDIESDDVEQANATVNSENDVTNKSDKSDDEMEEYLRACSSAGSVGSFMCGSSKEEQIRQTLKNFYGKQEPLTTKVLNYWEMHKHEWPELYKLASVIFAIPPTQTTVERAFSSLAIILTSHRTRLSDSSLQNILLVRLNSDLLK